MQSHTNQKATATPNSIQYLKKTSFKKLTEIGKRYNTDAYGVDSAVANYPLLYPILKPLLTLSCISWCIAPPFQVDKCIIGMDISADQMIGARLPRSISTVVAWIIGIGGNGPLVFAFSPDEKAIDTIMRYDRLPPFKPLIKQSYEYAKQNKLKAIYLTTKEFSVLTTNATGALVPALGLATVLVPLPLYYKIPAILAFTVPQLLFYLVYFDERRGKAILADKSIPTQLQLLREREYGLLAQINFQGWVSATGLRMLFYYFLTTAAENLLGWWFPAPIVLTGALFQGGITLYTTSKARCLDASVKADKILTEKHGAALDNFLKVNCLPATLKPQFIKSIREEEIKSQDVNETKEHKFYVLHRDPAVGAIVGVRTMIGCYLGYYAAPFISTSPWLTIPMTISTGIAFGYHLWGVESYRVKHEIFNANEEKKKLLHAPAEGDLEAEIKSAPVLECKKQNIPDEDKPSMCRRLVVDGLGTFFIVATGFLIFYMSVGTFQIPPSFLLTLLMLIAVERSGNNMLFNKTVRKTMSDWFDKDDSATVTTVSSTLFSATKKKEPAIQPEIEICKNPQHLHYQASRIVQVK